jgi:beta-lactam-binding protein with PASTA domain
MHRHIIRLPDYTGLTMNDVNHDPLHNDLNFIIIDSVYDETKEKGSIVMQEPPPNSTVKKGRKIYLTTVALLPEKVIMPDLKELSLRQAVSLLQTYGLKTGDLQFVPSQFENAVLDQKYSGQPIEPGTMIVKGSSIDLVVGKRGSKVPVPCLIGMTQEQAFTTVNQSSLNVGQLHFLDGNNPQHSRIYQQMPSCTTTVSLEMGTPVELWFRSDLNFNFDALRQMFQSDSTRIDSAVMENLNNESDTID